MGAKAKTAGEGVEKMILVRPSVISRLSAATAGGQQRRRRLPTATSAASGCCKRKQTGKQPRRKKKTRSTPSRGPTQRRGFPPQVGNRRAGSKVTKKRRRKRTAHRPEEDDDEDGDDLHLVATASPSQVAKLRRLRRLRRQLKVTKKRGPTWSRRDMLAYNAKLRNALEQQDLGPTVQGAAKAPVAVKGVLEPAWDSEDGDSEEDDGDEDEEAVSDVMAVREHVVPASVAVRARALLRLIRKTDAGRRQLTWTKHTHELVLKGRPMAGTDIFDLVVHVTRDRRSKRPKAGSPGPPPGFDRFARALRTLGVAAGREVMRNKRRWPQLFPPRDQDEGDTDATPKRKSWLLMWGGKNGDLLRGP